MGERGRSRAWHHLQRPLVWRTGACGAHRRSRRRRPGLGLGSRRCLARGGRSARGRWMRSASVRVVPPGNGDPARIPGRGAAPLGRSRLEPDGLLAGARRLSRGIAASWLCALAGRGEGAPTRVRWVRRCPPRDLLLPRGQAGPVPSPGRGRSLGIWTLPDRSRRVRVVDPALSRLMHRCGSPPCLGIPTSSCRPPASVQHLSRPPRQTAPAWCRWPHAVAVGRPGSQLPVLGGPSAATPAPPPVVSRTGTSPVSMRRVTAVCPEPDQAGYAPARRIAGGSGRRSQRSSA